MGVVIEQVLLFWAVTIAGVEAARGALAGGIKGDVLLEVLRSSTGVLDSLDFLEFGFKSTSFVLAIVVVSEESLLDEPFWILLDVESTCACLVLLLLPG